MPILCTGRKNKRGYVQFTFNIKLNFIKDMLEKERSNIYLDRDFLKRINKLFKINSLICEMSQKLLILTGKIPLRLVKIMFSKTKIFN